MYTLEYPNETSHNALAFNEKSRPSHMSVLIFQTRNAICPGTKHLRFKLEQGHTSRKSLRQRDQFIPTRVIGLHRCYVRLGTWQAPRTSLQFKADSRMVSLAVFSQRVD